MNLADLETPRLVLDAERMEANVARLKSRLVACATATQHDTYHVVKGGPEVIARWPRFGGW